MMFDLCLFDLDQTLVDTEDMKELREAGRNRSDSAYVTALQKAIAAKSDRQIYSFADLAALRKTFPKMRWGVFTRAPRSYAKEVLSVTYPKFKWDVVVAYEDTKRTKPYGDGIHNAMNELDIKDPSKVVVVGDGDVDVCAAYHAGCVTILDVQRWPRNHTSENWRALGHMPDAIVESSAQLTQALASYEGFLPELERRLSKAKSMLGSPRFDRVNKFIPKDAGGDRTAFPIHAAGRSFAGYASLKLRRQWHELTASIKAQKEAKIFPDEWLDAARLFIRSHYAPATWLGGQVHVTVIPQRPGRLPRMEMFLKQLEARCTAEPLGKLTLLFHPRLLA